MDQSPLNISLDDWEIEYHNIMISLHKFHTMMQRMAPKIPGEGFTGFALEVGEDTSITVRAFDYKVTARPRIVITEHGTVKAELNFIEHGTDKSVIVMTIDQRETISGLGDNGHPICMSVTEGATGKRLFRFVCSALFRSPICAPCYQEGVRPIDQSGLSTGQLTV